MKSKLAIAAIAAICIASPALAQAYDPDAGSGNIVADNRIAPQTVQNAGHRSGLNAYAMVPRQAATGASTEPSRNSGGNTGYTKMNVKY